MFEPFATSCDGGDCPTFSVNPTTGDVRVRGYDPTDPQRRRELDVDIPAADWARLVAQLPA